MTWVARESQLIAFVLVRLTALVLAVLVLGHFAVTHLVTDVAETDSGFVLRRWSAALWIAWDSAMLLAALAHAGCGFWLMIEQSAASGRGRHLKLGMALVVTGLAATGLAAIVLGVSRS
jgi:succinate dehydrogenase / fumarate reductase membrane anchor subunit